jgi:hypothetical protein
MCQTCMLRFSKETSQRPSILLGNEVDVGFLQLVLAIALGVAIPLMIFGMWLSGQLYMYLGRSFDQDLAEDADQD